MKIVVGDANYKHLKNLVRRIIDTGDEIVLMFGDINVAQIRFGSPIFKDIINEIGLDKIKEAQSEENKQSQKKFVRVMQAVNNPDQHVENS